MAGAAQTPPSTGEWRSGLYESAVDQLERVATLLDLDNESLTRLREPRRALTVNFPVRMDSGEILSFTGYRVQHTLTMGPTKGGLRFTPSLSLGECAALAMWMTWKTALIGLPYGGAKGGVCCDPSVLSLGERERVTRRLASELVPLIGPERDIPAPDVATGEREMAWFYDAYSQAVGYAVPGVVTGKPLVLGGIAARRTATGVGVVEVAAATLERLDGSVDGSSFAIQGFGNVGRAAAERVVELGGRVVAISDADGAIHDGDGLDIAALGAWYDEHLGFEGCPFGNPISTRETLIADCDVLIPAAIENQITAAVAADLSCSLIVEGANGPTTAEGEEILRRRGIPIAPDILANAGGVTASHYECVQANQRAPWDDRVVAERIAAHLRTATTQVVLAGEELDVDWRTAALSIAIERVASAARLRGVFP